MLSGHLSNEDVRLTFKFFIRLSSLFDAYRDKTHGSIYLTQKRLNYNVNEEPSDKSMMPSLNDPKPSKPLPILIRASDGRSGRLASKKIKLSTVVEANNLEGFFARYMEICKLGASKMKKRDRSKAKEKLKAKKKQIAATSRV
ncbi:putative signal recognition particle 14kd protein [Erysiphe neolycopersici]|uniref:Signal recognition particle subunit SRP14 n=1 Tax=Erysiphe neolycopersici TaxID=212602 RepID=A0A420I0J0_9PEZI|nr:putative signal recognition particle 14kd protein [Erysiphe neolycopersici]